MCKWIALGVVSMLLLIALIASAADHSQLGGYSLRSAGMLALLLLIFHDKGELAADDRWMRRRRR